MRRSKLIAGRGTFYALAAIAFISAIYLRTGWMIVTVLVVAIASFVTGLVASILRWQDRRNGVAADQQD